MKETEEGPIFYEKKNKSDYRLFFSQNPDDITTYSSEIKKWEDCYKE